MTELANPQLIELLRAATGRSRDLRLASFDRSLTDWTIANGLGPLLCWATAEDPERETSPLWPSVLSADLTAQVESGLQLTALTEILDRCRSIAPLVLLKGASIAPRHYPKPHLRPMRDLDLLVLAEHFDAVEEAISSLGYRRRRPGGEETPEDHHHGEPLWHPQTRAWVEVHRGLVPRDSELAEEPGFASAEVFARTVPFEVDGLEARRLSPELEVLHVACHWAARVSIPGGLVGLLDLALLLGRERLDWDRLTGWLEGPVTAIHFHLASTYLDGLRLAETPGEVADRARRGSRLNRTTLGILHRLTDQYVVDGKALERPVTENVFRSLWHDLQRPRPAWRNVVGLGRYLLPRPLRRSE